MVKHSNNSSLIKKDSFGEVLEEPEMTKDLDVTKINTAVLEITKKNRYEIMRCVNCPILLECTYPKRRLDALRAEAARLSQNIYNEEIELDNTAENILRAQNKRDNVYNNFIRDNAYSVLKNDRCIYEREEIINALQRFVDADYNIADPRVYLVVQELIGNLLNSGRANKAFTNLGLILRKDTPAGPIYYKNPLIESKIEFSRIIMEATETLDRMLKSDEKQVLANNFTEHLLKQLKIREAKKAKIIDGAFTSEDNADGNRTTRKE
jgi:hypothetical protein